MNKGNNFTFLLENSYFADKFLNHFNNFNNQYIMICLHFDIGELNTNGQEGGYSSKAEPITDPKILSNAAAWALALCSIFALLARIPGMRDVTTTTKTSCSGCGF